jgi:hypothetical protein
VVIVSVDGLRPDAIARFRADAMQGLMREGRWSLDARTILPSKTLPSHTSMLTGVPPDRHGITWNDDAVVGRGLVPVPTVFGVARRHGLHTAAFFGKAKFRHLMVPGTLDYAQAPTGWWGRWSARRTAYDVRAYLERTARAGGPPHLLFVHLGEPDYAGHAVGWMSWLYGRAVRTADEALAVVLAAADAAYGRGGYTLILTADHGGHRRTHGSADSLDVTIPWVAWGAGRGAGPRPRTRNPDHGHRRDSTLGARRRRAAGMGGPAGGRRVPAARRACEREVTAARSQRARILPLAQTRSVSSDAAEGAASGRARSAGTPRRRRRGTRFGARRTPPYTRARGMHNVAVSSRRGGSGEWWEVGGGGSWRTRVSRLP